MSGMPEDKNRMVIIPWEETSDIPDCWRSLQYVALSLVDCFLLLFCFPGGYQKSLVSLKLLVFISSCLIGNTPSVPWAL